MSEGVQRYEFTVPGNPKGQPRPRAARIGNFTRVYDPEEARSRKADIAAFAHAAGVRPIAGPVEVGIVALFPRPKRLMRKRDNDCWILAECKPDADNVAKSVCDALIGVAYADDASVAVLRCEKYYHAKGGVPATRITVRSIATADGGAA